MSMVQQAIVVGAPLHAVYEQIVAFEGYPRFMTGVERVTAIGADRTHWVMDLNGRRREFDAQITERSLDERVSWTTTDGPLLAETITLRPMGETRTQVVAQLEADIAFLMPGDRHGQQTLNRRLKDDLTTFKDLVEGGVTTAAGLRPKPGLSTGGARAGAVASRQTTGRSSAVFGGRTWPDLASPASVAARVKRHTNPSPSTVAGGSAPMGGRAPVKDLWGDGMINEADRGGAHDY